MNEHRHNLLKERPVQWWLDHTWKMVSLPTINRTLLPVKVAYFFYYFSFSSIIPFIPVFLREVGLNAAQAGIIFGTRTLVQFFTGPIWGVMADKKRKHKLFLIIQIVFSSWFMFSTPWIPKLLPKVHVPRKTANFQNASASNVPTTPISLPTTKGSGALSRSYDSSTTDQGISTTLGLSTNVFPTSANKGFTNINFTAPSMTEGNAESKRKSMKSSKTDMSDNINTTGPVSPTKNSTKKENGDEESYDLENNNPLLFAIMTIFFNIAAIFDGGIPLMIDTLIMEMVKKSALSKDGKKVDFGKQRLWGAVGFGLAAFASGTGVQLSGADEPNYLTMFYIYLASNTCLLIACTQLYKKTNDDIMADEQAEEEEEKPRIAKELLKSLSQFHILFWFATIFIMGLANGLLFGYMFWFIEDLNGEEILMGLSILVACSTEVIMFPIARKCIKMVGGNVIAVGLAVFSYAFRFIGFSYLTNAWYILLLQLTHAVGFAMFWAAAVAHTTFLAPPGMTTTFLGILNGIHFGVATGISTIAGGIAYKTFGGRVLYRFFAGVCTVWALFMLIFVVFEKRKERQRNLETEMDDVDTGVKLLEKAEMDGKAVNYNVKA